MSETPQYVKEVQQILANIHENGNGNGDTEPFDTTPPENEIDMYVEEDRITLIPRRLHGVPVNQQDIIDSVISDLDATPLPMQPAPQPTMNAATGLLPFGVFIILLCLFCIAAQLYFILNPFTVSVTLLAKSQQVSLQGTLQLGRVLNPITISQSQTVPTTGHGHQDARAATGYITFYNGQFQSITIAAGTILTGSSGVQIITDETASIPAANPPIFGQTTVPAHTMQAGSKDNIAAYDINDACCAQSVLAKNINPFTGGQDERNFQTVTKNDIANAAAPLQSDLAASVQGALQGQLKQGEQLQPPPCSPTVTPDHQIGQEATTVKVTVSEMCSSIAYNDQELTNKVMQLLSTQATKKLGAGYSILENPQISIIQATSNHTSPPLVFLSFKAQSAWVYALTTQEQRHMKQLIAGKTKEQAMQLLHNLPDIESASLEFSGLGDDTRIPKNLSNIHLTIFYGL